MGGISSKVDGVEFTHREEYMRWTLGDVKAAFARWKTLSHTAATMKAAAGATTGATAGTGSGAGSTAATVASGVPLFFVTRRQYWEIFTDYTVMRDGVFLCLPMEHYTVYDPEKTNKVFILEVFMLLTLFCVAPLDEKLQFVFTLFDYNSTGFLTCADMSMLIRAVVVGSFRAGITSTMPSKAKLKTLSREIFLSADINSDDTISFGEFEPWANSNVDSQTLIRKFGFVKSEESKVKKGTHMPMLDNDKRAILQQRMPNGRRSSLAVRMGHTIIEQARREVEAESTPSIGGEGSLLTTASFLNLKKLDKHTRARKLMVIANRKTLSDLVAKTEFTLAELQTLLANFVDGSDVTGRLNRAAFHSVLMKHMPGLTEDGIIDRVYQVLDIDNDEYINYRELCFALTTVMRGSLQDKLKLLFEIYDADGDETISIVELVTLIRKNDREFMQMVEFTEEVVMSLDTNGDGEISQEEFAESLKKDPVVLDIFAQCTSVSRQKARQCHVLLANSEGHSLTLESLHDLILSLGTGRGSLLKPYDQPMLRKWFMANFDFTEEHIKHIDAVHILFDDEKLGTVVIRDVVNALAQVLTRAIEDRAAFYFDMYDLDASGFLDRNEVMHMLLTAHEKTNRHASDVLRMLAQLDKDCDGQVTLEEFQERATREPLLMETLERMFMVRGDVVNVLEPKDTTKKSRRRRRQSLSMAVAQASSKPGSKRRARTSSRRSRPSVDSADGAAAAAAGAAPPKAASSKRKRRSLTKGGASPSGDSTTSQSASSLPPVAGASPKPGTAPASAKKKNPRRRRKSTTIDEGTMPLLS